MEMTWGEAFRLTERLLTESSSHVCAAVSGWQYPAAREALVLMDHYDAFVNATFKNPQPYPRPWVQESARRGSAMSVEEWERLKVARQNPEVKGADCG